jgi:hypothetical protein
MAKSTATTTPEFKKKIIKNKKLWAVWEVLDTISQITKIEILVFNLKNVVNF